MNVYIIYKFSEYDKLFPHIETFINDNPKDKIFYFKPQKEEYHPDWQNTADIKIAESDVVIYIRLNDSNNYKENEFDNIKFEISRAQEHRKKIIVVIIPFKKNLKDEVDKGVPSIIYEKDFLENDYIKYKVINVLNMKTIKATIFDMEKALFSKVNSEADAFSWLLLEEYKIMLDTSEKMMERRQGTNNFYITLCTAMLTVVVGFIATKANTFAWSGVTLIISLMMLVVCYNWMKTLEAYGLSNQAKYEVLNKIEEKLPASIFAGEWEYGKTIDYSSYSKRESNIPETFSFLFGILAIGMLFVLFLTYRGVIPEYLFH